MIAVFTFLSLLAFTANSLICRLVLRGGLMDAAGFTAVRLVSGAAMLLVLAPALRGRHRLAVDAKGALALVAYALFFSYAYVGITAGAGALIAFGAVQITMIGAGFWRGERLSGPEWAGLAMAVAGLVYLVLPGLSAPPLTAAMLMFLSGVAWGAYSLLGRGRGDPVHRTASNFFLAAPVALGVALIEHRSLHGTARGVAWAAVSGALTSAGGYILWYTALQSLKATRAAMVQLIAPVMTAAGGVLLMGEPATLRLFLAGVMVLGGVGFAVLHHLGKRPNVPKASTIRST